MLRPVRITALLWGLVLALGGTAMVLHQRWPGHRALPWMTAALLALLTLRLAAMIHDWRQDRLPGTRILLPLVVLFEGLGLVLTGGSELLLMLRLGMALALEILLLILAVRTWRASAARPGSWPEDRIAGAFEAFVPPRAARLMALELVLLGSAVHFLLGGFRREAPEGFSQHREAALRALLPVLPLLIPGDFLLLSVLFTGLPPWLRWTLHGSTVYAVLWLVGHYATLKARPHQLRDGQLALHLGLLKSATIPVGHILAIGPLPVFEDDWTRHAHMKGVQKLVAKGNTSLELKLAEPVAVLGLLGPSRPTDRLVFSVDDPAAFLTALARPCA